MLLGPALVSVPPNATAGAATNQSTVVIIKHDIDTYMQIHAGVAIKLFSCVAGVLLNLYAIHSDHFLMLVCHDLRLVVWGTLVSRAIK